MSGKTADSAFSLALAQLNFRVGDIEHNQRLIISALDAAHADNIDLVIFPELALTGYPPEDLLFRSSLAGMVTKSLATILQATANISAVIGHPEWADDERCYNAVSVFHQQTIMARYRKQHLPNYGVFDEQRYFAPGDKTMSAFSLNGAVLSLSICEDLWADAPAQYAQDMGADLLINISASPYTQTKMAERIALATRRARETGLDILCLNLLGAQDELVFDGGSFCVSASDGALYTAPQFHEGLFVIRWSRAHRWHTVTSPNAMQKGQQAEPPEATTYHALQWSIRDYVQKNNFPGILLGLSGGIDSALTLCLAVDALGANRTAAWMLPSRYTGDASITDATELAQHLKVPLMTCSIEPAFNAFLALLAKNIEKPETGLVAENLQARCRGILLMAMSNASGKLLLTTGNKSELATGYATLYGDMAGGFAPLKDIYKTWVYRLARWRNQRDPAIPVRIIERAPSAELRPDQRDEDTLLPYALLDGILEGYIEQGLSANALVERGFQKDDVRYTIDRVHASEHKRRQTPTGPKITSKGFGKDWRYPINPGYRDHA